MDNAPCRLLLEARPLKGEDYPKGLLYLIEEECQVPKGSDTGLLDKLFELAGPKHPSLRRPPKAHLLMATTYTHHGPRWRQGFRATPTMPTTPAVLSATLRTLAPYLLCIGGYV